MAGRFFFDGNKPVFSNHCYGNVTDQWINWSYHWSVTFGNGGDGFCFFTTQAAANQAVMDFWPLDRLTAMYCQVRKIQYRKGVCECDESQFLHDKIIRKALCRSFRIDYNHQETNHD